jgi:hypothetical protein
VSKKRATTTTSLDQVRAARDDLRAARALYLAAIGQARAEGYTLAAIARTLGISRQRVHQLLRELKPRTREANGNGS